MSKEAYAKALPRILVYEGGKVDDKADPGGRTNKGVTQGTYNAFRRKYGVAQQDVFLISETEVATIYKTMYWDKVRGDQLPLGLDLVVFDAGVNSGTGRAGIWLQQALGSAYQGQIDGQFGDKTMQAVVDCTDISGLIEDFCSRRLGTLKRLKTFSRFGKGWSARIANVQKIGLAWNASAPAPQPVDVTADSGHIKALVQDNLVQSPVSQIAAQVGTGLGSAGTVASQTASQLTPLTDTFGWIKYVFGGLTLAAIIAGVLAKIAADASTAAEHGAAVATVNPESDASYTSVPIDDNLPPPAILPEPAPSTV